MNTALQHIVVPRHRNSAQSSFFPLLLWWLLLLGFFHVVFLSLRLSYRCPGLLTKTKCVHTATVPNIPKYIYLTRSFSSFHNIPYTYSFSAAKLYMDSSTSFQLLSQKLRQCYYSNLDFQIWSDGGSPAADVIPSNQWGSWKRQELFTKHFGKVPKIEARNT